MQDLYSKSLEIGNIRKAIKTIDGNEGSLTQGPDGLNRMNCGSEETVIKEVKKRLRRYVKVNSKKVEIPKTDGKKRTITIINYYDRIAQQCVYQILSPILEPKMSEHSYGFRTGISTKVPVSRLCSSISSNKEYYTIEIDFEKCFDNIQLESAIGCLAKEFAIKDYLLMKTIKHLMITERGYEGIGLSQGTILGPLLCNVYLNKLDRFLEKEFELEKGYTHFNRDYGRHREEWVKWQISNNKRIVARYYRYADDSIIICKSKEDRDYCYRRIVKFIEENLEIRINDQKTKLGDNETVKFLGFKIKKTQSISITVGEEKKISDELSSRKLETHKDLVLFKKYVIGILNYYDICNNLSYIISKIENKLRYQGYKKGKGILDKRKNDQGTYYIEKKAKDPRNRIVFDIWEWRKNSKISYKDILFNQTWIKTRTWLIPDERFDIGVRDFVWILFTKQRGKDPVSGKNLRLNEMHVHHIKPIKGMGYNGLDNLILLSVETHKKVHSRNDEGNKKLKRLIEALGSK